MSANKDAASSSAAEQSEKDASGEVHAEKSVDKLNVREFCERFCIPNGVSVQLMDGEAVSTEKSADNAIFFTKEQFNAGLRFPLPSLFKEFLHFTQIPPAYILPTWSGTDGVQHSEHAVQPGPFIVGGAKGHVLVRGVWAGLMEHPERPFSPNRSLVLPVRQLVGYGQEGRVSSGWKKRLRRLNKLFEITAAERHHQTLLTTRNLLPLSGSPKRRRPGTQSFLNEREKEGKRELCEGPGDKRSAPLPPADAPVGKKKKGIVIRSPALSGLPSTSSDSVRVPGQNGSGPSMPAAERMAFLGLPPCESSSLALVPVKGLAAGRSRPARDLKSGISGRLQDRLLKPSKSATHPPKDHPRE
ncbi:hypothetical protein CK203_030448 [Vitis vinifera]|uniref:Uncharacterized protein n=1 Tax=Vitis vinifera TaxID=29760 RepID=A0A438JDI8_VITVI|nr:hypothetical protein CK203_030448 [Vitis vinifera]